jgi:hypothetical protein
MKQSKSTYAAAKIVASVFADKFIFMLQHRLLYQVVFVKMKFHLIASPEAYSVLLVTNII